MQGMKHWRGNVMAQGGIMHITRLLVHNSEAHTLREASVGALLPGDALGSKKRVKVTADVDNTGIDKGGQSLSGIWRLPHTPFIPSLFP
ncbi:unnamed protein product [Boreogadus saida]